MLKQKPVKQTSPLVCIQQIETRWTKASRGGEGAVARNQVPEVFPFPLLTHSPITTSFFLQMINFSEGFPSLKGVGFKNKYEHDLQVLAIAEPFCFRGVSACLSDGSLNVEYEYKWEQGMPWRYSTTNEVAHLQVDQWCRVLFNGRFSSYRYATGECDHWYDKWVINIGLFSKISPGNFLKTEPIKTYSRMAELW